MDKASVPVFVRAKEGQASFAVDRARGLAFLGRYKQTHAEFFKRTKSTREGSDRLGTGNENNTWSRVVANLGANLIVVDSVGKRVISAQHVRNLLDAGFEVRMRDITPDGTLAAELQARVKARNFSGTKALTKMENEWLINDDNMQRMMAKVHENFAATPDKKRVDKRKLCEEINSILRSHHTAGL
jgi:hypothetical protein